MGPPEGRVRTTVLPGCGEGRARAPRPAADGQHMRNRAGRAAKTGSITTDVSGPAGRAWSPATVSAAFTAHAATSTIYACAINLYRPWMAFSRCLRYAASPPFSLRFAIPALHAFFPVGDF